MSHETGLYEQLLPAGDYIRVLAFKRPSRWKTRRYILSTLSIGSREPYLALSYRWRSDAVPHRILINGQPVYVMQTVKTFLDVHFRKQDLPIFVDSICINQQDLEERAKQVQLMGKVYANAAKVCIWLGDDCSISESRDLRQALEQRYETVEPRLRLAKKIFMKAYWTRAWITQELVLARKLEFFWGTAVLSALDLHLIVEAYSPWDDSDISSASLAFRNKDNKHMPLQELLSLYKRTSASDSRDKVYALLGLASDVKATEPFPVDYSDQHSTACVLRDVLSFCNPDPDESLSFTLDLARSLGL